MHECGININSRNDSVKPRAIQDNFESIPYFDETGKQIDTLPRYAVWGYKGHWSGKNEVVECSDSLEYLKGKYGKDLPMFTIDDLNRGS